MIANYGYIDGSGEYFITIVTDKCDGCGQCVAMCPQNVFQIITDDYDNMVASVSGEHRNKIKYSCRPCKLNIQDVSLPCVAACKLGAITHSW